MGTLRYYSRTAAGGPLANHVLVGGGCYRSAPNRVETFQRHGHIHLLEPLEREKQAHIQQQL